MKIAFVLERARLDGTVRFAVRSTRMLRQRGHHVVIWCAEGSMTAELERAGARVRHANSLADASRAPEPCELNEFREDVAMCDAVVAVAGAAFPFVLAADVKPPLFLDLLSNDLFVSDAALVVDAVHEAGTLGGQLKVYQPRALQNVPARA